MSTEKSFDPVTVGKIKRSALLALGGFFVAAVPMILSDQVIMGYIQANPYAGLFAGSFVPFLINSVREWMKGQE